MARTKVTFYIDHATDEDGWTDPHDRTGLTERGYEEVSSAVSEMGGVDFEAEVVS